MIKIKEFKEFLYSQFVSEKIYYEEFKPELHFAEVDCFSENSILKLAIQISIEDVRFSTVSKKTEIDFSLYDYYKNSNKEAEEFLLSIKNKGWPE